MKKYNGTSGKPKVTVLMPVYNGEKYLREAIDSILNQTFTDFEFLIIDDGSTDCTWRIMKEHAARDPRIVLVHNDTNLGLTKSLNKGLDMAKGEYVARMDADDISLPERLAAQASFLDKHPDVGVVGTFAQKIDKNGCCMAMWRFPTMHDSLFWALCFTTPLVHPSVMFRKTIIENIGGYNEKLLVNQDRDLWQRLSCVTRFANLPNIHLLYRWHSDNTTNRHAEIQARNSAMAGQRMMSEILGYEVPFEICHNIRRGRFDTVDDAIDAARLILPLYNAYVSKHPLTAFEDRMIRKDAASRLFNLAWRWKQRPRTWQFFAAATQLDPLIVAKALGKKAKHKTLNTFKSNACFSLL